jgi:carbamoyltransferase
MPQQHVYVLGLNTCDHDVSACLLRDGEIAFAIAKERITREKHASDIGRVPTEWCRSRTIWRMPTAPSPCRRSRKAW